MNRIVICILFWIIFHSCAPSIDDPKRLYIKEIITSDLHIEWFFYSLISNTTPDYVILNSNNQTDTICIANNITEVYLKADTIYISSDGYPRRIDKLAEVKENIQGYVIRLETDKTAYYNVRPYYTKKE